MQDASGLTRDRGWVGLAGVAARCRRRVDGVCQSLCRLQGVFSTCTYRQRKKNCEVTSMHRQAARAGLRGNCRQMHT